MFKKIILSLFFFPFLLKAQAPKSYSSSEILLQLKKLNTVGSVLYIAAHPDDENTRLIAYLANEKCLRTGYLSLTRGDGGQNLIGPEQGVELGLIRTQELLAARRIDGGEQFFTRAYDFGFSKTPEETFEKWNKDSILSDVVWVIRNFRPDIIINRFPPDSRAGHGHHTASAILAEEAFDAAADSTRFPEQLKYVKVWKARRMFFNISRFADPKVETGNYIKLDVGGYNALLGKSYGEIAAESRSMHKSQGFGSARQRGEFMEYFKSVKGDTANLKDIFDRMDFSWKRVKGGDIIGKICDEAIRNYDLNRPYKTADLLTTKRLSDLLISLYIHDKVDLTNKIILASSGITIDATYSNYNVTMGDTGQFSVSIINRSDLFYKSNYIPYNPVKDPKTIDTMFTILLIPNKITTYKEYFKIPNDKNYISTPIWLGKMPDGIFHINNQNLIGLTENPYKTYSKTLVGITSKNGTFSSSFPIQYRWVDPEKGELYRPLVIIPPVLLTMENEVLTFLDDNSKEIKVKVKAGRDSLNAKVKLQIPANWKSEPTEINVSLLKKNEEQTVVFKVTPPIREAFAGSEVFPCKASAEVNGETYTKSIREIKYDHIPIQTWFPEAEAKLLRLDIKKTAKRIGYIPGAGDEVQECLAQLGYEVVTITDAMLTNDDLKNYNTIITGVRAYNTNPLLTTYKKKLMDYVSNGGNLIVQYNTNSFAGPFKGDFGPKPFKLTRERVTDEYAKVNFELPGHQVLNTPNKITEKDFEGWIQERGIYFAGDIDSTYECPLSMNDKGEKPNKGSLIISKHGKGTFIYTGLVFFRELPAGVPGAYRLMVNLIEAK